MKKIKQRLMIFIKTNNLSLKLYIVSVIVYMFSLFAMSIIDYRSSLDLSKLIMSTVFGLVIVGNLLSFLKKNKSDKSRYSNLVIAITIFSYTVYEYFIKK